MERKRTKIVATISDKNCSTEFLSQLFEAGMDIVRINSAHLDIEGALKIINNTRKVSDKIAILIDTKGPEIRTTICDTPVQIKKGDIYRIIGDPEKKTTEKSIYVTYKSFSSVVPLGSSILIDDGDIQLNVIRKNGEALECFADNDGRWVREKV